MANQTITFNQPGIKIFMTDDYAFLDGMANNTITVDIRNTGENYLVFPQMYRVTDKNGNHPSGNTANGTYFTEIEAKIARTAMINTVYNGNEYTQDVDNYYSILSLENSSIWNPYEIEENPLQCIIALDKKGNSYTEYSYTFYSTNSRWPSAINSAGLWFTGYDVDGGGGYICSKINDTATYDSYYKDIIVYEPVVQRSPADILDMLGNNHLGSSNLYSVVSNWSQTNNLQLVGLAYIGQGIKSTENVTANAIYNSGENGTLMRNVNFLYNGSAPSLVLGVSGRENYSWSVLRIHANARVDQGSGTTESVIIVERLQ